MYEAFSYRANHPEGAFGASRMLYARGGTDGQPGGYGQATRDWLSAGSGPGGPAVRQLPSCRSASGLTGLDRSTLFKVVQLWDIAPGKRFIYLFVIYVTIVRLAVNEVYFSAGTGLVPSA